MTGRGAAGSASLSVWVGPPRRAAADWQALCEELQQKYANAVGQVAALQAVTQSAAASQHRCRYTGAGWAGHGALGDGPRHGRGEQPFKSLKNILLT